MEVVKEEDPPVDGPAGVLPVDGPAGAPPSHRWTQLGYSPCGWTSWGTLHMNGPAGVPPSPVDGPAGVHPHPL